MASRIFCFSSAPYALEYLKTDLSLGYLKMDLSIDKTESSLSNKESLKDFSIFEIFVEYLSQLLSAISFSLFSR